MVTVSRVANNGRIYRSLRKEVDKRFSWRTGCTYFYDICFSDIIQPSMSERFPEKQLIERRAARVRGMEDLLKEQLRPPSREDEERLYLLSEEELMANYRRRAEIFHEILTAERSGRTLTDDEIRLMRQWLKAANGMDRYLIRVLEDEEGGTVLSDEQLEVFLAIHTALEQGITSGYVKYPTGGGKTVIFAEMAKAMEVPTLAVVPTLDLVHQTVGKFEKFAPKMSTGKIMGGVRQLSEQTTVITYDSFCDLIESGELDPKKFACLILDEAHLALSPRRQKVVEQFAHAIRIGFTATPDYSEDKKLSQLLPHEIASLSIMEAVDKRIIAGFSVILAKTRISIDAVNRTKVKGYDKKQLERAINVEARNKAAVQLYRKLAPNGEKAIFFCGGVTHAEEVAKLLREANVPAEVVYGKLPKQERKDRLKRSQDGETRGLCGADLLVCGYDDAEVKLVFLLAESQSVVRVTQAAGRGLRLKRDTKGKVIPKHAVIIHFLDLFSDPSAAPVFFSDIAGGAQILPKSNLREEEGMSDSEERMLPAKIDVEGLTVITDTTEVMRMTRQTVRTKELYEMKPNEEGWFMIDGREYGTISRFAKELGLRVKDVEGYIAQAEKGGKTFTTEEKYSASGTVDIFLRDEMMGFLKERTKPVEAPLKQPEPIRVQEGAETIIIEGVEWGSIEYLAERLKIDYKKLADFFRGVNVSELARLPAERIFKYTRETSGKVVERKAAIFLFPVDEATQYYLRKSLEIRTARERALDSQSKNKEYIERLEKRGWFCWQGRVHVSGSWTEREFQPLNSISAFKTVTSLNGVRGVAVKGIKTKFYPFEQVRAAYLAIRAHREEISSWQAELVAKVFEFIDTEDLDSGIEERIDKK